MNIQLADKETTFQSANKRVELNLRVIIILQLSHKQIGVQCTVHWAISSLPTKLSGKFEVNSSVTKETFGSNNRLD